MIELQHDPIVEVRVRYAIRSGRLEVDAGKATADSVLVALSKALYATLAAGVKVQT